MKRFVSLFLLLLSFQSISQTDTITLVSYNLLNFPDGRDDCGSNTVVPNRADTLRKILQYTRPDIFVGCEIQHEAGSDSILTRSLNVFGNTQYAAAAYHANNGVESLQNRLFYNTNKLTLQWQDVIISNPRDIDHYVLYMNDPNLGVFFDTIFIEVYMCHLKAGSGGTESGIRAQQTQELMNYISLRPSDRNHFVCGDMNVYSSSESAYQNFLNGAAGLIDPINSPGSWNNNASFAAIHTQSTRVNGNFDCGSTGGTDDRFDQILVSANVMGGSDSLKYIPNTYTAVGNDGNHFNTGLLSAPTNTMYPDSVVRALYYMSDHMPVTLKALVTYPTSNGLALVPSTTPTTCPNGNDGTATITPNDGQPPYQYLWDVNAGSQTSSTATNLIAGSYCVVVIDNLGEQDDYCMYIGEPAAMSYSTFVTPETSNCNGVIHLVLQGGTPPYTITWNDPISQTGQSAYNLCAGIYEAQVVDAFGCVTIISTEVLDLTAGIGLINNSDLKIYPNPALDIVNIKVTNNQLINQISISDLMGREVLNESALNGDSIVQLSIGDLSQGEYFLTITTDQFHKITSRLIVR